MELELRCGHHALWGCTILTRGVNGNSVDLVIALVVGGSSAYYWYYSFKGEDRWSPFRSRIFFRCLLPIDAFLDALHYRRQTRGVCTPATTAKEEMRWDSR